MGFISQLGIDSWGGFLSFILTIGSVVLPILWRFRKKRKKLDEKMSQLGSNYILISNYKKWHPAPAKILKFAFASTLIPVTKKWLKDISLHGSAPLVAEVEFQDHKGVKMQGQVFIGDEVYEEGEIINVVYNPLDKKQIILS